MKRIGKKFLLIALCIVFVLVITSCRRGGTSGQTGPIRLRYNHTVAEASLWHTYSVLFADRIFERTNGRYVIDIFPMSQLAAGNQARTLEMLRAGTIDIGLHSTTIWAGLDERFSIVLMPWLYRSYDEVLEFVNGPSGDAFLTLVSENGVVPIAMGDDGFREVLSIRGPIRRPEDMRNLKIRVPGMTMFIDMYRVLGADPTTMNWGEVFSALQQRTIDAMECPPELLETGRFHEVTNHLTVWGGCWDPIILVMSEQLRDSLSPEDLEIFMEAGRETMRDQFQAQMIANVTSIDLMAPYVEVAHLTEQEINEWIIAIQPLYDMWRDRFPEELRRAMNYDR